jgi:hypothetical protein
MMHERLLERMLRLSAWRNDLVGHRALSAKNVSVARKPAFLAVEPLDTCSLPDSLGERSPASGKGEDARRKMKEGTKKKGSIRFVRC